MFGSKRHNLQNTNGLRFIGVDEKPVRGKYLIFIYLFWLSLGAAEANTLALTLNPSRATFNQFKTSVSDNGINLVWTLVGNVASEKITIERARFGEDFEILGTVSADVNEFEDDLALFGVFRYRLKVLGPKESIYSDVVEVETYLGTHFTRLPQYKGERGLAPIQIVFGHMEKFEEVTVVLYKTNADMVGEPYEYTLNNQRFKMEIDTFHKGEYVCMIKSVNWPISIFRFSVK